MKNFKAKHKHIIKVYIFDPLFSKKKNRWKKFQHNKWQTIHEWYYNDYNDSSLNTCCCCFFFIFFWTVHLFINLRYVSFSLSLHLFIIIIYIQLGSSKKKKTFHDMMTPWPYNNSLIYVNQKWMKWKHNRINFI